MFYSVGNITLRILYILYLVRYIVYAFIVQHTCIRVLDKQISYGIVLCTSKFLYSLDMKKLFHVLISAVHSMYEGGTVLVSCLGPESIE